MVAAATVLATLAAVLVTTVAPLPASAQTRPGVPGDVRAVDVDDATVVTWNRPSGRPTNYRVQFRTATPEPRIVGGVPASADDAPYQVAIFLPTTFCGGTMVTDRVVITAAHCVADIARASDIEVAAGELRLSRISRSDVVGVSSFAVHPAYRNQRGNFDNDVAVLRLSRPIPDAVPIAIDTDAATPDRRHAGPDQRLGHHAFRWTATRSAPGRGGGDPSRSRGTLPQLRQRLPGRHHVVRRRPGRWRRRRHLSGR